MSLRYLAWAVRSLWQSGAAGWETYVAAVVVLAVGGEAGGDPLR